MWPSPSLCPWDIGAGAARYVWDRTMLMVIDGGAPRGARPRDTDVAPRPTKRDRLPVPTSGDLSSAPPLPPTVSAALIG